MHRKIFYIISIWLDLIDMDYEPDEYVVQRDDGSCYKRFKDYSEARDYYNYLQQLDDQRRSVQQNDEIIANQKRLLEMQARNNQTHSRPQVTRQVMDPEYLEWLRYKKATDPAYLKWKKEEDAKKAKEAAERNRIAQERYRQQEESHKKSEVGVYKAKFKKYRDAIAAYEKWYPIIQKLSTFGAAPLYDIITNREDHSGFDYGVKEFLKYKSGYPGFDRMKKAYYEMQNEGLTKTFSSINLEYSYWQSHYKDLIYHHKQMQRCIGKDSRIGLKAYLERLIGNLCGAKDYRRWGFFGLEGEIRRKYKAYWEKFQHIYPIIASHVSNWQSDIGLMYVENHDEDDD